MFEGRPKFQESDDFILLEFSYILAGIFSIFMEFLMILLFRLFFPLRTLHPVYLKNYWNKLSPDNQLIFVLQTIVIFVGLIFMGYMVSKKERYTFNTTENTVRFYKRFTFDETVNVDQITTITLENRTRHRFDPKYEVNVNTKKVSFTIYKPGGFIYAEQRYYLLQKLLDGYTVNFKDDLSSTIGGD